MLVIPEMWDPGWSATVDGRPVAVLQANFNEQAVTVPRGTAEVRLTFRPVGLAKGAVVSLASLVVCLGILGNGVWRARRRSGRPPLLRHRPVSGTGPTY